MINTIVPVVIWFNPNQNSVDNINKYSSIFTKIIIVDNSPTDNSLFSNQIVNSLYIPNNRNLGIAKALNIGCQKAIELGFKYVMTMDQDSSWNSDILNQYIKLCKNNETSTIKSFAPVHSNKTKSVAGYIRSYLKKNIPQNNIAFPDKVMSSGNIVSLDVMKEVGFFNEDLFIDEVDHEFCYKLLSHGYKIIEFNTVLMEHTLGNVKKSILPKPCKHNGVRLYYIFRNILYIRKNFNIFYQRNGYKKYILFTIIQKVFEFNISDLKFIFKGINAYKNNLFGEYQ